MSCRFNQPDAKRTIQPRAIDRSNLHHQVTEKSSLRLRVERKTQPVVLSNFHQISPSCPGDRSGFTATRTETESQTISRRELVMVFPSL